MSPGLSDFLPDINIFPLSIWTFHISKYLMPLRPTDSRTSSFQLPPGGRKKTGRAPVTFLITCDARQISKICSSGLIRVMVACVLVWFSKVILPRCVNQSRLRQS